MPAGCSSSSPDAGMFQPIGCDEPFMGTAGPACASLSAEGYILVRSNCGPIDGGWCAFDVVTESQGQAVAGTWSSMLYGPNDGFVAVGLPVPYRINDLSGQRVFVDVTTFVTECLGLGGLEPASLLRSGIYDEAGRLLLLSASFVSLVDGGVLSGADDLFGRLVWTRDPPGSACADSGVVRSNLLIPQSDGGATRLTPGDHAIVVKDGLQYCVGLTRAPAPGPYDVRCGSLTLFAYRVGFIGRIAANDR